MTDEEINDLVTRAMNWKKKEFERKITPECIETLFEMGFNFGPGVRTLHEKKQSFVRWVRENPMFRFPTPQETIDAMQRCSK